MDAERIKHWVDKISDDYGHFTDEQKDILLNIVCPQLNITEYGDDGVMAFNMVADVDFVPRASLVVFYIVPEKRGGKLFYKMIKDLEQQALNDGAVEVVIGNSISGYKENKFNSIFSRFGYNTNIVWTKKV